MTKVISPRNLPPQFPGLFLFCCWLGYRFDPDWLFAYTIAGTLRLMWWYLSARAIDPVNLFREP